MTNYKTTLRVEALEARETPAILFGVTGSNRLITFDSANPTVLLSSVPISGFFATGEVITDIDVRPGNGALYGRSNFDRLFLINPLNPLAVPFGPTTPIVGRPEGMDFDPRTDRIHIYSNLGENVVIDSVSGTLIRVDTPLSYQAGDISVGAPRVTGLAFVNSVPGALVTGVFAIDHYRNTLVRPTTGTRLSQGLLSTVGFLGPNVGARVGFDIAPLTNTAFASFQINNGVGISRLYTINLGTGRATAIGRIGSGIIVNDIAVDLQNTSGFFSSAGFGALPPPQGLLSLGFDSSFKSTKSSEFSSSTQISPVGTSVTTSPEPILIGNSGTSGDF